MALYTCWSSLDGAKSARETAGKNPKNAAENHALWELEQLKTHNERTIVVCVKSLRDGKIRTFEVAFIAKVIRELTK